MEVESNKPDSGEGSLCKAEGAMTGIHVKQAEPASMLQRRKALYACRGKVWLCESEGGKQKK